MSDVPDHGTADPDLVMVEDRDETAPAREVKLREGIANLASNTRRAIDGERALFLLGAFLTPLGFLVIQIGWHGAAGKGREIEQTPYLISAGLGGLGLMIVGAALYSAWWQTRRIRQADAQHQELLAAHAELAEKVAELSAAVAGSTARDNGAVRRRAPLRAAAED